MTLFTSRRGAEEEPKRAEAQLAVLAVCNSGRGSVVAGEGVVGLARALMACGVPTKDIVRASAPLFFSSDPTLLLR